MSRKYAHTRGRAYPQSKGYGEAGASLIKKALKGFIAESGSPIDDIDTHNMTMRQRGRILFMASPIATSAITTNRTNIIGVGLKLQARPNASMLGLSDDAAKAWQAQTEAEFALWANKKQHCDALGINNFAGLQQLALTSWLMNGDVFGVLKRYEAKSYAPYTLRVHLIEADRVSTPTKFKSNVWVGLTEGKTEDGNPIHDGVEVDGDGMIAAYHICNSYPDKHFIEDTNWTRVTAYGSKTGLPNVLHVMSSERCEQYRGVSYLAPVIEPLLQIRRFTESELVAALVQSFFTAWVTTEADAGNMPLKSTVFDDDKITDDEREYEMAPGQINMLKPGESIKFGSPNIPQSGFEKFVKAIAVQVGAALEMPADILLKEFNKSYSAARAALLEAWKAFKMRRKWFVDDFCQPLYEVWLSEAIARGRIKAPGFFSDPLIRAAWCGANWVGPAQGQLDPIKEGKAAIMMADRGFKTHEQITTELDGGNWSENIDQLSRENERLMNAGGGKYMATLDDGSTNDGQEE